MPVPLYHQIDGPADAPVLLLGPSLGTSTQLWCPQVPALAARFRVVRYDLRGHGRSPVPAGPYTLADLGGDLIELLDHLGVRRAHLAGLSLGGMVSMWVAAHAPRRVDRLALMCTSARLGPHEMWAQRAATVAERGVAALADAVLARWFPEGFAQGSADVVARMRAVLLSTPASGYAACCAAIQTMNLEPDLPSIGAATLVIAGSADESTPPSHAERIVALIPGAKLALVAGAAHLANLYRPDLVTGLLLNFLEAGDD